MARPRFQFGLKAVFGVMTVVVMVVSGWLNRAALTLAVVGRDLFFWLVVFWLFLAISELIRRREPRP